MKVRLKKIEGVSLDSKKITGIIEEKANKKLGPILQKYNATDTTLQVAVTKNRDKSIKCKIHLHVPGKKILVAEGKGPDIEASIKDGVTKIFREAKRHFERLEAQDQYKRKERRKRLHELKTKITGIPEATRVEAEKVLAELKDRLRTIVRRELAYLRATGDLSPGYPTVDDVVDEALAKTISLWKPGATKEEAWEEVLKNAFDVINQEVENSKQYGKPVSIYEKLPPTPEEQAEAMVQDEFYEFYQPDDILTFSDVIPEEAADVGEAAPLTEAEEIKKGEDASAEAYSWDVLKDLPIKWRRCFILAKIEGMSPKFIASVIGASEEDVRNWIEQSRMFVYARLIEAGISREEAENFTSSTKKGTGKNNK